MKKVIITTGDIDGIGLEVASKALLDPAVRRLRFVPILFISASLKGRWQQKYVSELIKFWTVFQFEELADGLDFLARTKNPSLRTLIIIASKKSPAYWVEEAAKNCLSKKADALVTGPLSKTLILESGLKDIGHTDILKRISRTTKVNMGFIGKHFSVILASDHIPLSKVATKVTEKQLTDTLDNANLLRKFLGSKKPIGVLGFNPHAGEEGLLGGEELRLKKALTKWTQMNITPVKGFLVPDAAFLKDQWKQYSCYVCMYHDQGLIPFKLVHGQDSGVHISLGIPFIRTSVDHGTAKDIFNKNKANPSSMIDAITCAFKMTRRNGR